MSTLDERVTRIEERQSGFEQEQSRMWKEQSRIWKRLESMDDHLQGIQKTLNKIFYTAAGFGAMYVVQTVGLAEVLKKALL